MLVRISTRKTHFGRLIPIVATPGAIHEGGELGYALAVAFGAVMDNPNLIVPCVVSCFLSSCVVPLLTARKVGDGEAETGPTATAWHAFKYIDPKERYKVQHLLHYYICSTFVQWCRAPNCSRKWLQDLRAYDLRMHGQQRNRCSFHVCPFVCPWTFILSFVH